MFGIKCIYSINEILCIYVILLYLRSAAKQQRTIKQVPGLYGEDACTQRRKLKLMT